MQETNLAAETGRTDSTQENVANTPKELTLAEYKKAMAAFFTVRRHTVVECGHKFDMERQPSNNCEYCWFAFFQNHGEVVQTADEVFTKYGAEALDKIKGQKFRKNFTRFMATLAKFKESEKEINVESGVES